MPGKVLKSHEVAAFPQRAQGYLVLITLNLPAKTPAGFFIARSGPVIIASGSVNLNQLNESFIVNPNVDFTIKNIGKSTITVLT